MSGAPAPNDPRRCSARTSSGRPCRAWAIKGGTVCVTHGGRAPQVQKAARRRVEEEARRARAERYLQRRLGGDIDTDPLTALEHVVALDLADVEALREIVAELPASPPPEALAAWREAQIELAVWQATPADERGPRPAVPPYPRSLHGVNHLGDRVPALEVQMYRDAKDDLRRSSSAAAAAGVAERGATMREAEGAMIARMLDALIRDPRLHLTAVQREAARVAAAEGLLRLEAEVVGEAA